jgi:hypothetical protein
MKWIATFTGRMVEDIGEPYHTVIEVEGSTHREAILAIYETHEHVSFPVLVNSEGVTFTGHEGHQVSG